MAIDDAIQGESNQILAAEPLPPPPRGVMTLRAALAQASVYLRSGLLPASVRTPEAAVVIMAMARELGVRPLAAFRLIYVVDGAPSCSAQLVMALVRRDHGPDALRILETTNDHATVEATDGRYTHSFTWTIEDARQAGLLSKDNWKRYPRAMLRARAIAEAARTVFPESLGGLYTVEELDAPVTVYDTGEIESPAEGTLSFRTTAHDAAPEVFAPPPPPQRELTPRDALGYDPPESDASFDETSAQPYEPSSPTPPTRPRVLPNDPIQSQQILTIQAHLNRVGISETATLAPFGGRTLEELSRAEGQQLIGRLSRLSNRAR